MCTGTVLSPQADRVFQQLVKYTEFDVKQNWDNPGAVSYAFLAHDLNIPKPSARRAVRELRKAGYHIENVFGKRGAIRLV